ncbi:MAG: hypothetical protein M3540_07075 [Actinomycetota bacterium]|nr:hypothetical protein [Actinomycetota bacterium]
MVHILTEAALVIMPGDLIGAATVASLLGIDKSSVTRRVAAGKLPALAQLDGPGGAYVFNKPDILALVATTTK